MADLVDSGNWNMDMLSHWRPADVLSKLNAIVPPTLLVLVMGRTLVGGLTANMVPSRMVLC